jgi:phage tail-like protein
MTRRPDWLVAQLPVGMLEDDFFRRFTSIFQDMADTIVEGVDSIDHSVDVTVAPEPMVRFLGSWIGVHSIDPSLPVELQRAVVRGAADALTWRGTRRGLLTYLGVICGEGVEIDETGGVFREGEAPRAAPTVVVRAPSTGWVTDADFARLVLDELPANTSCTIEVAGRQIWPAMSEEPAA